MHLEDTVVMYGVYNVGTLEKLVNTVHIMHNTTTLNEKLFIGDFNAAFTWYINQRGVQHYAINILLYLRTLREKYVKMYEEFKMQLHIYTKVIRILTKAYLPISLITPLHLQSILDEIKTAVQKTNLGYDKGFKRLHLYYDTKLVTFSIDTDKNLIVQFPVFIQPYTQQLLILYRLETVPVLIIDQNTQADSYTCLQIDRQYIALNSETYIQQQELRTCKRIGY